MKDEKQKEVYAQLERYIEQREEKKIQIIFKKYGIEFFKSFRTHGSGLLQLLLVYDLKKMIEWVVEEGWDVNETSADGDNLLFCAVGLGKYEYLIDYLIEKGIDVNHISEDGYTPILSASAIGEFELGKKLYQHGADINARTEKGKDIVHFITASLFDNKETKEWIDLLLSEPERCEEKLLKKLKKIRLELLF